MKKIILAGVMALCISGAVAQQKIAHIDTDQLMSSMPEAQKIDTELKGYSVELQSIYVQLNKDYAAKDSAYVKDSLAFTPTMKKIRLEELINLSQRLNNWQQEAQELYNEEAENKIAPLREKALTAIKAVAKENGYGYVMESGSMLVMPPADDLLPLVKKKLNIVDKPATPVPAPKTK